jgi:hypothetical protein
MRFESKRGQNGKKREKNRVLQFEKMYFLSCFFFAGSLALHFKDV